MKSPFHSRTAASDKSADSIRMPIAVTKPSQASSQKEVMAQLHRALDNLITAPFMLALGKRPCFQTVEFWSYKQYLV